ncbi:HAD family hydrolase [Candidatus Woesearchaeota archaeon]|nr:HAD family hydrolase [Candidatus Woesearchaeota archaeon]
MKKNRTVILDRDGVMIEDYGYVYKIEDLKFINGAIEGLKLLKDFKLIIITNQGGIGKGYYTEDDFLKFNDYLVNLLRKEDIKIEKTYYCKHKPEENCECRKPKTKNVELAAKEFNIDLENSYVIGDKPSDIELGNKIGCKTIYVLSGQGEKYVAELDSNSIPTIIRKNLLEAAKWIKEDLTS